jgi:hypothetical protein
VHSSRAILRAWPKPIRWGIYKVSSKAVWLGNIEAPDETAAIEESAAEFKGRPTG